MKNIIGKVILLIYITTLGILCFTSMSSLSPYATKTILGLASDKVVHFCMFLPFAICVYWAFSFKTSSNWWIFFNTMLIFGLGIICAGGTEIIQKYCPNRCPDVEDFYADCIGIVLGTFLILLFQIGRKKQ